MGSRVLGVIECDRCHATDEGPDDYWPRGWHKVRIDGDKIGLPMFVICADCYALLRVWLAHSDGQRGHGDHVPREIEAVARQLAEAIRNHGPWMDDQCRAVLAAYDSLYSDGRGVPDGEA